MSTDLKAIPTEYKGVRFRSKSEAIFARCLDLAGVEDWQYEPNISGLAWPYWKLPQHPWDFCVTTKKGFSNSHLIFVEYKPAFPSSAYMENLSEKVKAHVEKFRLEIEICDYLELHHYGHASHFFSSYQQIRSIVEKQGKTLADVLESWKVGSHSYVLVYGSPFVGPVSANGEESYVTCPLSFLCGKYRITPCIEQITAYPAFFSETWGAESVFGITEKMAQEARSYRFDLKH
jgi:hypothetical protein